MRGNRLWLGILGLAFLLNGGCCSMWERWCGPRHHPSHAPSCVPCAPVSAPVCCPTPVGSSPAPAWARTPGCP